MNCLGSVDNLIRVAASQGPRPLDRKAEPEVLAPTISYLPDLTH
jgi:hypothetical protein